MGLAKKIQNNIKTNIDSIVFYVQDKLPLNEIPNDEIIPNNIQLNNFEYQTDVVQSSTPEFLSCYNYSLSNNDVNKLQGNLLPLKGGQELVIFPEGFSPSNYSYCTLGFLCVDDIDNKFVGITAAHSVVSRLQLGGTRDLLIEDADPYNTYEKKLSYDGISYRPGVGIWANKTTTSTPQVISDYVKRYNGLYPSSTNIVNYADVAVISLGNSGIPTSSLIDINSHKIYVPSGYEEYPTPMQFATTQELNNLLIDNPIIYSTGRTTGPKGYFIDSGQVFCRMRIDTINSSFSVPLRGTNYLFGDTMLFSFSSDEPDYSPVSLGDSGSAVIADYGNGIRKIIGVVFARAGIYACANRIDRIVEQLNVREWDWTEDSSLSSRLELSSPIVSKRNVTDPMITSNRSVIDGKIYHQCGFSKTTYG